MLSPWLYGEGLIYLTANISAKKISLPQGQSYSEGKYTSSDVWLQHL